MNLCNNILGGNELLAVKTFWVAPGNPVTIGAGYGLLIATHHNNGNANVMICSAFYNKWLGDSDAKCEVTHPTEYQTTITSRQSHLHCTFICS